MDNNLGSISRTFGKIVVVNKAKAEMSKKQKTLCDWQIWGIPMYGREKAILLKKIEESMLGGEGKWWIATVNPEFIMAAGEDSDFRRVLTDKTTVNVVDGIGLVWAKRVLEKRGLDRWTTAWRTGLDVLKGKLRGEVVSGADLIDDLCRIAVQHQKTIYFFGGWGDRAKRTAEYFLKKYPKLKVAGAKAEDYDFDIKADILLVARGMKKQEEWIRDNWDNLKVGLVMGVGRSFDYYSGDLSRAPGWMRKVGLEWLYSLYKEPKRWRRQLRLPKFVAKVMWGK